MHQTNSLVKGKKKTLITLFYCKTIAIVIYNSYVFIYVLFKSGYKHRYRNHANIYKDILLYIQLFSRSGFQVVSTFQMKFVSVFR